MALSARSDYQSAKRAVEGTRSLEESAQASALRILRRVFGEFNIQAAMNELGMNATEAGQDDAGWDQAL